MRNSGFLWAHLALFTVAVLYGVNYFTLKTVLDAEYDTFGLVAWRCIAGCVVFVLFQLLVVREKIRDRKDYLRLILCSITGISLNQELFVGGMAHTEKVNAAVLMIMTPLFVFVIAWWLKQEVMSRLKLIGLLFAFAGALALTLVNFSGTGLRFTTDTLPGDIMITLNAASYGLYLVLVRPLVLKYNTFTIITWLFVFGSIPTVLIGFRGMMEMDYAGMQGDILTGVVVLIAGATIVAYFLNAWAMRRLPSSAVGVYIFAQPVFVTVGTFLLEPEKFRWDKIAFILLILMGVYLVAGRKSTAVPSRK